MGVPCESIMQLLHGEGLDPDGVRNSFLRTFCEHFGALEGDRSHPIKDFMSGELENYIECIDVDYKSIRTERFYSLELPIHAEDGQELNIRESIRRLTSAELLDGSNLYEAEGHGKQRARRGIRFSYLPPLLFFEVQRLIEDPYSIGMSKLESRFEYPQRLDLSEFAPDAGAYVLTAVVVHRGKGTDDDYATYLRPQADGEWLFFEQGTVAASTEYAAMEANFGGSQLTVCDYFKFAPGALHQPTKAPSYSACMLAYIREDALLSSSFPDNIDGKGNTSKGKGKGKTGNRFQRVFEHVRRSKGKGKKGKKGKGKGSQTECDQ